MRYSLAALVRAKNVRRKVILFRPTPAPATLASDLYAACYKPIVQALLDIAERVITEYRRTTVTDGLTTDGIADIQGAINAGDDFLSRLFVLLTPKLSDWALRIERYQRGKWRGAVLSASGVDLETILLSNTQPAAVSETIAWNLALIKDVSAQGQSRIAAAVFAGLRERSPARDVAKAVREAVAMSRRRSMFIASDQLSKITSALDRERRADAGLDSFRWRSSHKVHFRPEHAARDGKEYTDETAPKDRAGTLPWCGCREQAVLRLD